MIGEKNVTILITVPEECRNKLRQIAAEATLKDPKKQMSGAGLAGKIVCWFLKKNGIDILNIDRLLNDNNSPSSDVKDHREEDKKPEKQNINHCKNGVRTKNSNGGLLVEIVSPKKIP